MHVVEHYVDIKIYVLYIHNDDQLAPRLKNE